MVSDPPFSSPSSPFPRSYEEERDPSSSSLRTLLQTAATPSFENVDEIRLKIVLLGVQGVGKTTLRSSYVGEEESEVDRAHIEGINFLFHLDVVDDTLFRMQLWDIDNYDLFLQLKNQYFYGTSAIILVYDRTDEESLNALYDLVEEAWEKSGRSVVPCIVVGNKADLRHPPPVDSQQVALLVHFLNTRLEQLGVETRHFIVSAKTGYNVKRAFHYLLQMVKLSLFHASSSSSPSSPSSSLFSSSSPSPSSFSSPS